MTAPLHTTVDDTSAFDIAGFAGLLGGDEAVLAMIATPTYKGGRWLGWYNSPACYAIAKHFYGMVGPNFKQDSDNSPAVTLGLNCEKGPECIAPLSGVTTRTGHLAYLTMKRSKMLESYVIKGRDTMPFGVSYLAMKPVDYNAPLELLPLRNALFGLIPIGVSMLMCIMCALLYDWHSFATILISIISNGLARYDITHGKLVIEFAHNPASEFVPGPCILIGEDEVIVIKGKDRDVNAITRARFDLQRGEKQGAWAVLRRIPNAAIILRSIVGNLLLGVQFMQLSVLPGGILAGQLMFFTSIYVSWIYNSRLSTTDSKKTQMELLFRRLQNPQMMRFHAGTRATMAVFVCLLLFHGSKRSSSKNDKTLRERTVRSCLAINTPVLDRWLEKVVEQTLNIDESAPSLIYLEVDENDESMLSGKDLDLLKEWLGDAHVACKAYLDVRGSLPVDSSVGHTIADTH